MVRRVLTREEQGGDVDSQNEEGWGERLDVADVLLNLASVLMVATAALGLYVMKTWCFAAYMTRKFAQIYDKREETSMTRPSTTE